MCAVRYFRQYRSDSVFRSASIDRYLPIFVRDIAILSKYFRDPARLGKISPVSVPDSEGTHPYCVLLAGCSHALVQLWKSTPRCAPHTCPTMLHPTSPHGFERASSPVAGHWPCFRLLLRSCWTRPCLLCATVPRSIRRLWLHGTADEPTSQRTFHNFTVSGHQIAGQ